ncbi:HAMP domain-containing sensor histidine kinase [Vitreimonas sp.]|uniref:sensor histidine kinase n=1 Tax=Vitreimonas sp. TaxID=3069702 RepID=UPI002D794335|nr:HAMP domain-containing sensor histidine kinase [Vitreimonas sp.]
MRLALAFWFWLAGVTVAAALSWITGAEMRLLGGAVALALAPALAGFIMLPYLGRKPVDTAMVAVWLISGVGLAAGSGGAGSPLAAMLILAPAMALALGRRWAPEAGAAAALGYALAAALALVEEEAALGGFAEALAAVSIAFAAGLMAIAQAMPAAAREGAMERRVAEVSHELRTPLTHILGFAEMIERQIFGEVGARYVEYAGLIRRSGTHLLGLVNDLLDLSKIEAGRFDLELETFDVRGVVEEVVRLSADSAEKKRIALSMVTPEAPLLAHADARALKRILINTVSNAIKFTPEDGRVMVAAAVRDGVIVLETIDSGPGIPEAERATLGQAYERGSGGARAEGTGLGLSLVRALAALHGGSLSFHDAPGGGALVRVTLPVLVSGGS